MLLEWWTILGTAVMHGSVREAGIIVSDPAALHRFQRVSHSGISFITSGGSGQFSHLGTELQQTRSCYVIPIMPSIASWLPVPSHIRFETSILDCIAKNRPVPTYLQSKSCIKNLLCTGTQVLEWTDTFPLMQNPQKYHCRVIVIAVMKMVHQSNNIWSAVVTWH